VSTSLLYHTQCIRNYQYESSEYGDSEVIWNIRRKSFCCDKCGYPGASISVSGERLIKGEKIGNKHFFLRVPVHRIYCSECKNITTEQLPFLSSLKAKISTVAMDMSKTYISWVEENLPNAQKVFDHFHLIKLMNDKLDKIRRRTVKELDEEQKALLKNQRFLFLRNVEDLEADAKQLLDNLRKVFKELGDASMMKEALRSIYHMAGNNFQAETAFKNWCSIARQTEIKELIDMAKTIENNLEGITAYWKTNALSNAGMEGFNNKVRWLIRQPYGFRDKDYFILKIYNLPNTKIEAAI